MTELEFRLPDIGEGIATAEILTWKVAEGDRVREDDELVEIQTDKAIAVISCPATGTVARLCADEGDTVDVGALLAVFARDASVAAAPVAAAPASAAAPAAVSDSTPPPAAAPASVPDPPPAAPAAEPPPPGPDPRPLAAPATRRLARERGVALSAITGSGPHGRILRSDVERAAGAPAPAPPPSGRDATSPAGPGAPAGPAAAAVPGEVIPLRGVRRAIALNLTRAWLEVPRVIDYREVDATALVRARDALRRRAAQRGDDALAAAMTPTPLIVRAAVRALRDHPMVNASIDLGREEITLHGHYHVGIATAAPDGLMVPVLRDADRRSLADTAREIARLSSAARERRLGAQELSGATFTVNNYGGLGIWLGTPLIVPPEVANLGVGAIRDQVVAVDGRPVVRPTLVLAVAGDHRVLDGDTLGAFVSQVVALLEEPLLLFEDLG